MIKKALSTTENQTEVQHRRKRKRSDKYDEPLKEFLERRKKAKKEKQQSKKGLQLMMTDYFKYTKPLIKHEKNEKNPKAPVGTSDILRSQQYDFDRSAVPEDDDIEILEIVPSKDTEERKAKPFIYIVNNTDVPTFKCECKPEPQPHDDVEEKPTPQPKISGETVSEVVDSSTNKTPDNDDVDDKVPTISLEVESAREENVDNPDKLTDRETMLMQEVAKLTKGLEEMKSSIRRKRKAAVMKLLASKVKRHVRKSTSGMKSKIFENTKKVPQVLHPPPAENPSEIQWEQVDDAKEQPMKPYVPVTDVKIGVENSHPTFIPIILESAKSQVSPNTETAESQVTESEAMRIICNSEGDTNFTQHDSLHEKSLDDDEKDVPAPEEDNIDKPEELNGGSGIQKQDNEILDDVNPQQNDASIDTPNVPNKNDHKPQEVEKTVEMEKNREEEEKCKNKEISAKDMTPQVEDIKALQKGIQNMEMRANDDPNSRKELSEEDEEQPSEEDDEQPSDEELLDGDVDLSYDENYDEGKLLDDLGKSKVDIDDSSSGASRMYAPVGQEPNSEDLFNDDEVSDRNLIAAAEKLTGPTVDCRTQPSQSQEYDEQPSDNQQNLPSFPATFGKSSTSAMAAVNHDTVARMKTIIHPPGTNTSMQTIMKSQLPSTGSVSSETEILTQVEEVMESRMIAAGWKSDAAAMERPVAAVRGDGGMAGNTGATDVAKVSSGVLQTKDQNVMKSPSSGPSKLKPVDSDDESTVDIETDPFYSGAHYNFFFVKFKMSLL